MRRPETQYATTPDGANVAYQVVGEGPVDLLFSPDWVTHCESWWEHPRLVAALDQLTSIGRLIMFDKRGIGMSDRAPVGDVPSLQTWVDDLRAVLDAAGSQRPVLYGMGHGGQLALLFAATFPDRTAALVLLNAYSRLAAAPDYPFGYDADTERYVVERSRAEWGRTGWVVDFLVPELNDQTLRDWFARVERLACTPATGAVLQQATFEQDVREILPTIHVPTLILQSSRSLHVRVDHGRYLAERIPDATYVELDSRDQWAPLGGAAGRVLEEMARFLGTVPSPPTNERVLATLLFTDVVESTPLVQSQGDRAWRELLDRLDDLVTDHVRRYGGRVVSTAGDGHFAAFDGTGRAVRCAQQLVGAAARLGVPLRAGLHTGEVEVRGDDVAGIAVHVAQRVSSVAQPGEVLVSGTVRDLVAGSDLRFADRGRHELKGVSDARDLYAVVG